MNNTSLMKNEKGFWQGSAGVGIWIFYSGLQKKKTNSLCVHTVTILGSYYIRQTTDKSQKCRLSPWLNRRNWLDETDPVSITRWIDDQCYRHFRSDIRWKLQKTFRLSWILMAVHGGHATAGISILRFSSWQPRYAVLQVNFRVRQDMEEILGKLFKQWD